MERPDFFSLQNGSKSKLPFSNKEYQERLNKLRNIMSSHNLDMIILTSMHNVAYYTGFIYCSFGRSYGCVITEKKLLQYLPTLMQASPGGIHFVKILFIQIGREIIF